MKWYQQLFTAFLAVILISLPSGAGVPRTSAAVAKLTEAHGEIFKRGFVSWQREEWGDPEQAQVGDILKEGMQLGTGNQSWAQVSWPNVTTRAWENTVFAIAPNKKLVYLIGGEMLFNLKKKRKHKGDYYVWTKVLQARIRGTTVMIQSTPDVSRFSVLEGYADVMNRSDHSVIRVHPGVVYEIKTKAEKPEIVPLSQRQDMQQKLNQAKEGPTGDKPQGINSKDPQLQAGPDMQNSGQKRTDLVSKAMVDRVPSVQATGSLQNSLTSMYVENRDPVQVFENKMNITDLYTANADQLMDHPLVQGFEKQLGSAKLIKDALGKLPEICHPGAIPKADHNLPQTLHQQMLESAEIVRVPTKMAYRIGNLIGNTMKLPAGAAMHWPAAGIIGDATPAIDPYIALPTQGARPGAAGQHHRQPGKFGQEQAQRPGFVRPGGQDVTSRIMRQAGQAAGGFPGVSAAGANAARVPINVGAGRVPVNAGHIPVNIPQPVAVPGRVAPVNVRPAARPPVRPQFRPGALNIQQNLRP